MQWNIQAIYTHFNDLKYLLNKHNPTCICLQETLINNRPIYPPSGYSILTSTPTRNDNHERGTAILIRNNIFHKQINLNTNLQAVAAKVYIDKIYTICSIYLPHTEITKRDLSQLINQLQPPFLILGDFNAKSPVWGGDAVPRADARGRVIEELLLDHPISILNNNTPTHYHIQTNSYSIIDLSICSSDSINNFQFSVDDLLHGSDHFPIHLKILNLDNNIWEQPLRYNFKKADWSLFCSSTETTNNAIEFPNINELIEYISNNLTSAANSSIPMKSNKPRKPPIPWWSEELTRLKIDRNRAERTLRRNHNIENKIAYNRTKAKLRYYSNIAKRQSWQKYLSSINQNTTLNQIWKKVQMINGKFKQHPCPTLKDINGNYIFDRKHVANILADHFANVSNPTNYTQRFQHYRQEKEQQRLNFTTRNEFSFNSPFSEVEFGAGLCSASESSPGPDSISYSMIKHCHPTMKNLILQAFNRIYTENVFPDSWTLATIVAIAKPGKDQSNPQNYRPISLTNCLCKLMEKLINVRLVWYLEQNKIITNFQSGFRANRSTTDNLVQIETAIQHSLDNKQHFIAIFFDLKKAYDTAWKFGILKKLHDFGLRGNLPLFLRGFLSNRRIKVRVGNSYSDEKAVIEGIPQGSVLSCTLFMIAINDICDGIPNNVNKTLYVDDFTIYAAAATTRMVERRLQVAMSNLERWCNGTGFQFSVAKTVSLHICRKRNCPKISPNLSIFETPIASVDQVKYLGVIFDKGLTWKPHISQLRVRAFKTLDLLKHFTNKKWGADCISLLRLYIMLLKPMIEYGIEIFSSAAKTYMHQIEVLQNSAIRTATGAFKSSPIPSIHSYSGIKPLKYFIETKMLNYYLRVKVNELHPLHEILNDEHPPKSYLTRAKLLVQEYDLNLNLLDAEPYPDDPPWGRKNIEICTEMFEYKRNRNTQQEMKYRYEQHLMQHNEQLNIYTDGSKIDNGVGYSYSIEDNIISATISPIATIFTAELLAILDAIIYVKNNINHLHINIITDSKSAIQAIDKLNNRNPIVNQIILETTQSDKLINLCWVPSHCGVPGNEAVDNAARTAASNAIISNRKIPRDDFKTYIKQTSKMRWKNSWQAINGNKLRHIKDSTTPLPLSHFKDRLWERVVCRIRIGHTALTHGFLMSNEAPPQCQHCSVPLTVHHIIMICPHYAIARRNFGTYSYKQLLNDHVDKFGIIYNFILEIGLLYQL